MATIRRITVSSGATINMGNYQNLRRDVTIEAELEKGENKDDAFADLQLEADMQLAFSVTPLVEADLRPEAAYIAKAGDSAAQVRRAGYESPLFRWLNSFMPELAAEVLTEVLKDVATDTEALAVATPDEAADDDDELLDDGVFAEDDDDNDDEPDYTGDGYTEEHDHGYPADAHPDEVEYEKARATYPDLPPYAEAEDDEPTR